jgi:autotransporter-associated beta strand protein
MFLPGCMRITKETLFDVKLPRISAGPAGAILLCAAVMACVLGWYSPAHAIDQTYIGGNLNAFGDYSQYHFYMYSSVNVVAAAPDEKFGGLTSDNTCTFDISQNIVTGQLNEDANYAGIIYDNTGFSGSLTKVGTGEFILSGVNTYKGGTYINGGAIGVYNDWNLGDASGGLGFDGGTLRYYGTFTSARSITLNSGGGTFDTNGFSPTLSGVISGAGSLTKTGLGTLTLTGANTYTGDTIIDGGTLKLAASNALSDQTDVIINGISPSNRTSL